MCDSGSRQIVYRIMQRAEFGKTPGDRPQGNYPCGLPYA